MSERTLRRDRPPMAHEDAARIEILGLTKRFLTPKGEPFTAIHDVALTVEPGEFCAIVGPTGCGKSTTLAQVSGLEKPSAGEVRVGGTLVDGITNGVSYMFQSDSLFPWKTVLGNVMIGPTLLGTPKAKATTLAGEAGATLGPALSIVEGGAEGPLRTPKGESTAPLPEEEGAPPTKPGTSTVTATVNVVFELL